MAVIPMKDELMVQQQIQGEWQHMVAVMCLNQTYRKQVKWVLPQLFARYPTPQKFLAGRQATQERILKPLGMWRVRTARIRRMTQEFLDWDLNDANELHGIGKYGADSYKIFFKGMIPNDVQDKELKKYVESLAS